MLAHLKAVYILSAVNKTTFDQTDKVIKNNSSQKSIQMNRIGKKEWEVKPN